MRTRRRFGVAVLGLAALALLLTDGGRAGAAPITWGPRTGIAGDTDVDTTGTLVAAFNIGGIDTPSTTVNGVTFQGLALGPSPVTSGNFTFATSSGGNFGASDNAGSANPPFSNFSAPYKTLLSSIAGGPTFTVTMNGLTVSHEYEFEWWLNQGKGGTNRFLTEATAGTSVTLSSDTGNGVGQFAIGTFTADATSELITFTDNGGLAGIPAIDGLQLRDITPATPVPEPSTFALLALGGAALAGWRRWRKRRA